MSDQVSGDVPPEASPPDASSRGGPEPAPPRGQRSWLRQHALPVVLVCVAALGAGGAAAAVAAAARRPPNCAGRGVERQLAASDVPPGFTVVRRNGISVAVPRRFQELPLDEKVLRPLAAGSPGVPRTRSDAAAMALHVLSAGGRFLYYDPHTGDTLALVHDGHGSGCAIPGDALADLAARTRGSGYTGVDTRAVTVGGRACGELTAVGPATGAIPNARVTQLVATDGHGTYNLETIVQPASQPDVDRIVASFRIG